VETHGASVAANGQELGVLECHLGEIDLEVRDGVLVDDVALVPVVGNTLVAGSVLEVAIRSRDREELLQHLAVELALRIFGRLVCHEAVDKGVRSRLHWAGQLCSISRKARSLTQKTGEGTVEEVRVGVDALLEHDGTEIGECLQVVVVLGLAEVVKPLEPRHDQFVVLTVHI
jgi:hypothetical protein